MFRRILGICLLTSSLFPTNAQSSCNLIPVAGSRYPSILGGIESPITAPDKTVTISLTDCDASAGFESIPTSNRVELSFEPPAAGPTIVAIDPATVTVANCGMMSGRCTELSFPMPDTVVLPRHGLAGPGRILVHDGSNELVAEIGKLFLPTASCDREPEPIFQTFTFLPKPNVFASAAGGGSPELLATIDGGGNLLVPFDYWGDGAQSVLAETPGAPVAILLQGGAAIPAMSASDPTTIQDALAAQPSASDFVRSFTLVGRPLPPLLRVTETGSILGTADAVESVLRIARNDGAGGPNLYNLADRLSDGGTGPILIDTFNVAVGTPVPLDSLHASATTIAFARDEAAEITNLNYSSGDRDTRDSVVQIGDALSGGELNTSMAVTRLPARFFGFLAPALIA